MIAIESATLGVICCSDTSVPHTRSAVEKYLFEVELIILFDCLTHTHARARAHTHPRTNARTTLAHS